MADEKNIQHGLRLAKDTLLVDFLKNAGITINSDDGSYVYSPCWITIKEDGLEVCSTKDLPRKIKEEALFVMGNDSNAKKMADWFKLKNKEMTPEQFLREKYKLVDFANLTLNGHSWLEIMKEYAESLQPTPSPDVEAMAEAYADSKTSEKYDWDMIYDAFIKGHQASHQDAAQVQEWNQLAAANEEIKRLRELWVSVKDRLPEEGGRYWCYVQELTDLGWSYFQWNCAYNDKEKRFSDSTLTNGENVTHWMPLPEPPKTKEGSHEL